MIDEFPNVIMERFIFCTICSVDSNTTVQSVAQEGLRRYATPDFENELLVNDLYKLYMGTDIQKESSNLLKIKILQIIAKSKRASNKLPQTVQVSFDALYGPQTSPKLRVAGMSFVQAVFRLSDLSSLVPVAPVFLSGLLKLIADVNLDDVVRGFAYNAIAILSTRTPELFENDVELLIKFFDAINTESRLFLFLIVSKVRSDVQEALSHLMTAYKKVLTNSPEMRNLVLEILKVNIHKEKHARYIAVKYCKNIFPFSNAICRYLCLVASNDFKLDIKEEARLGLSIPDLNEDEWELTNQESLYPQLSELVKIINEEKSKVNSSPRLPGTHFVMNLALPVFSNVLCFLRSILIVKTSNVHTKMFCSAIQDQQKLEGGHRAMFIAALKNYSDKEGLDGYLKLIEIALNNVYSDGSLLSIASLFLLELISFGPHSLSLAYFNRIDWIYGYLSFQNQETRTNMAHILGIVSTLDLDNKHDSFIILLDGIITSSKDNSKGAFDLRHGSICALGFIIGRCIYRHPFDYQNIISDQLFEKALVTIADALETKSMLINAACSALSEIGRYGSLPRGTYAGTATTAESINETLISLAKTSPEIKIQEAAILALGHLSLGSPFLVERTIEFFKTLPQELSKNPEIHFNVGESICAMLFGFLSTQMEAYIDITDVAYSFRSTPDKERATNFCNFVIDMVAPAQSSINRKTGCIWLLCIVKYCSKIDIVMSLLLKIHSSFSSLLADRDG
jgi:proteasome component ECM29